MQTLMAGAITALHDGFAKQFEDFKTVKSEMHMTQYPFTCSVDNASSDVELELTDLIHLLQNTSSQDHSCIFILFSKRRAFHTLEGSEDVASLCSSYVRKHSQ